jgi:two-component system chemotaxis response regulator CheY
MRIEFSHLRFMVIDDNAYMRRVIRAVLGGFGVREVTEAEDGAAGLELFAQVAPDIVILDWEMPILNGIDVAKMIRQPGSSANAYVPIIMVTAHSEEARVVKARDAGVTEFLAKPISPKSLYQRVFNAVAHPRPFVRTATYFGPDRRRGAASTYYGPERRGVAAVATGAEPETSWAAI